MHTQDEHIFSPDIEGGVFLGDIYIPLAPELEHGDLSTGSEQSEGLNFDMNSWTSTVEESIANMLQSESGVDAGLRVLIEPIDQPNEHHTNNEVNNTTLTFPAVGTGPSSQLSSSEASSTNSDMIPIISSKHQSYLCSWHLHDSGAQCDHVAPNRPAFLRHLAEMHQVSGDQGTTIICQLLDSKIGSACNTSIKRGNYPRHVDTHYPLRYHCQYCDHGTSFSRQDSWMKHMRSKHA